MRSLGCSLAGAGGLGVDETGRGRRKYYTDVVGQEEALQP